MKIHDKLHKKSESLIWAFFNLLPLILPFVVFIQLISTRHQQNVDLNLTSLYSLLSQSFSLCFSRMRYDSFVFPIFKPIVSLFFNISSEVTFSGWCANQPVSAYLCSYCLYLFVIDFIKLAYHIITFIPNWLIDEFEKRS